MNRGGEEEVWECWKLNNDLKFRQHKMTTLGGIEVAARPDIADLAGLVGPVAMSGSAGPRPEVEGDGGPEGSGKGAREIDGVVDAVSWYAGE